MSPTLRSLLVLALASTASCFSLQQPALVRGTAPAPLRLARSLRMEEADAPKEAATTPVDFTPAAPVEEEKKGFDPTQCVPSPACASAVPLREARTHSGLLRRLRRYSITLSIGFLFLVIKALSYSGILDFDD